MATKDFNLKAPSWKTRAVRHSSIRVMRQLRERPKEKQESGYFLNSEESVPTRFKGVPKNKGRRLHLETIEDSEQDMTKSKFKSK